MFLRFDTIIRFSHVFLRRKIVISNNCDFEDWKPTLKWILSAWTLDYHSCGSRLHLQIIATVLLSSAWHRPPPPTRFECMPPACSYNPSIIASISASNECQMFCGGVAVVTATILPSIATA
jgi:hypothetical protein